MQDGQKLQSDFSSRIHALEEQLNKVTGQVEEGDHKTAQKIQEQIKNLEEKISVFETAINTSDEKLANIENKLKEILKTLKKSSRAKEKSLYNRAMANYKAKKYKTAKRLLISLLKKKKGLKKAQRARILHNLGMISYTKKENNEAIVYFGRLFTQYPKSSYNKNGLLFTARTFIRQKKKREAKQALNELIGNFPKAKQVKQARKLLGSLK